MHMLDIRVPTANIKYSSCLIAVALTAVTMDGCLTLSHFLSSSILFEQRKKADCRLSVSKSQSSIFQMTSKLPLNQVVEEVLHTRGASKKHLPNFATAYTLVKQKMPEIIVYVHFDHQVCLSH